MGGANSSEYDVTKYYVTRSGVNTLSQYLDMAVDQVQVANKTFTQFQQFAPLLKHVCKNWTPDEIAEDFSVINTGVTICQKIVSLDNIYPYYDNTVHKDFCGTAIASMGWLFSFHLIVALFLLPALATTSGSFFTKWAEWQDREAQPQHVSLIADSQTAGRSARLIQGIEPPS